MTTFKQFLESTNVTDYNPKSHGGTRAELLAKYAKTGSSRDAEAARKAGATQAELKKARRPVSESSEHFNRLQSKIAGVLIHLYDKGHDEKSMVAMKDQIAAQLGYQPTDPLFQRAFDSSFDVQDFSDEHITRDDIRDEYMEGVAESSESKSDYDARMRRLAASYNNMSPEREARMSKIPGWSNQKKQALDYVKRHPKNNKQGVAEGAFDHMSEEDLKNHIDDLRARANALKQKAKTSKKARDEYYELVSQHHQASQKLYGLDEQSTVEGSEQHRDLVSQFLKSISPAEMKYYSIRDNCGPAALHMKEWAQKQGIQLRRRRGYFAADNVVHEKADFTPEMKREFLQQGLDFNDSRARKKFIESNPEYREEWKKVPHYWLEDNQGNVYDPTGHIQFIKTGLAKDLDNQRYLSETLGVAEGVRKDSKPGWMLRLMRDKKDPVYDKIVDKQVAMAALKLPSKKQEKVGEGVGDIINYGNYVPLPKTTKLKKTKTNSKRGAQFPTTDPAQKSLINTLWFYSQSDAT